MLDVLIGLIFLVGCFTLWVGLGYVVVMVLWDLADRAMDFLIQGSGRREKLAWFLWPLTLFAGLLMQINPQFRGNSPPWDRQPYRRYRWS